MPVNTEYIDGVTVLSSVSLNGSGATLSALAIVGSNLSTSGKVVVPAGTAIAPTVTFASEQSLGFYRSAASVLALSYGHLQGSISYSGNTASTSATTANQTVQGSLRVSILSLTTNGAEIAVRSGNTTWKFASVLVG